MGFIKNIRNWSDLKFIVFLIAITSLLMIFCYFMYFGVYLHRPLGDVEDWGSFGSYMGSITGLLAFAGVLYTVMQSDKRAEEAKGKAIIAEEKAKAREEKATEQAVRREERDLFFKMLSEYQRQADLITKNKSFSDFTKDDGIKSIIYIIYENIVGDENFKLSEDADILFIQQEIAQSFGINAHNEAISNDVIAQNLKDKIKICFETNNFGVPKYLLNNNLNRNLQKYFIRVILPKISEQNIDKYIFNALRGIADMIFINNEDQLGQYFRTIYYILETISSNIERENYSKIFRSQLSKSELTLLLYNLVSSQSTPKTIKLYKTNDIFNNLNLNDLFMNKLFKDKYKGNDFINMLYNEYDLLGYD